MLVGQGAFCQFFLAVSFLRDWRALLPAKGRIDPPSLSAARMDFRLGEKRSNTQL